MKITAKIDLSLGTHSTECTWQIFRMINAARQFRIMMKIRRHGQTNEYDWQVIMYANTCTHHILQRGNRKKHPYFLCIFICMEQLTEQDCTTNSEAQPRKNTLTMRKVDTSNYIMVITIITIISSWSPILKCTSWIHIISYAAKKTKVIQQFCILMITRSSGPKTGYDPNKSIAYKMWWFNPTKHEPRKRIWWCWNEYIFFLNFIYWLMK